MCVFCKGSMMQDVTDYVEHSENLVVLVKGVPCEKCNQCGETYFDNDTVQSLEHLLDNVQNVSSEITLTVMNYAKNVA